MARTILLVLGAMLAASLLLFLLFGGPWQQPIPSAEPLPRPTRESAASNEPDSVSHTGLVRTDLAPPQPAEAKASAPTHTLVELTITTVDEQYRALPDTTLKAWNRATLLSQSATNRAGTGVLRVPLGIECEIRAHRGDASVERVLLIPRPEMSAITIQLHPSGSLCGWVRLPGSSVGIEGIRVAVWPAAQKLPTAQEFDQACRLGQGSLAAVSDSSGAFCIRGLRKGGEYSWVAAGKGYIAGSASTPVRADTEPLQIQVQRLAYLALQMVDDSSGLPIESAPEWAPGSAVVATLDGKQLALAPIPAGASSFVLNCESSGASAAKQVFLLSSAALSPASMPGVELHIELPGYEPWSGSLTPRWYEGQINRQEVRLRRMALGFGELRVHLPSSMHGKSGASRFPEAILTLDGAQGDTLQFALHSNPEGLVVLRQIPYGIYGCTLAAVSMGYFYPGPEAARISVQIQATPAEFVALDEASGSLQFQVRHADESEYAGPLVITIMEGRPPADRLTGFRASGDRLSFAGWPYQARLLKAGVYTIIPRHPACLEPFVVETVRSGERTDCQLHLNPR